jgi:type 1 fimbriae regulatory protein FimB
MPLSRNTAWLMIRDYGRAAGLSVEVHPHMLRHTCGFALADQGADTRLSQGYLRHWNIQHINKDVRCFPCLVRHHSSLFRP